MINIAIVIGSTRPGRKGEGVARWVHEAASRRQDAAFEIVDIAEFHLPFLDEPVPAAARQYSQLHTKVWASRIDAFDGFVFVTPEYNRSTSAVLKNALDFLYAEWNDKAATFVGYGGAGGTGAIDHLRTIVNALRMVDLPVQVTLSLFTDFENGTLLRPQPEKERSLLAMLDELVTAAQRLQNTRSPRVAKEKVS